MALLSSRTHHTSHRLERSLSREPSSRHLPQDRSPIDHEFSSSISTPRKSVPQKLYHRNGESHRRTDCNYPDQKRERIPDRSQDRNLNARHDANGSCVQTRIRDNANDDDLNERYPVEKSSRKIDHTSHERNRQADCYRGGRSHRDNNNYNHSYRSNYNEVESGSTRDRNERRDYRQVNQSGSLYFKDKHNYSSYRSYGRQSDIRHVEFTAYLRPQNQHYQSSSQRRRHYSPRALPSPSKSPMRRPFKSRHVVKENDDRYIKRRRLDYRSEKHDQNRQSRRFRNQGTSFNRSFAPSRSRSQTPSDYFRLRSSSQSPSRSRTRSRSKNRAESRSCSRSHSAHLHDPPAGSLSPLPPVPPRSPKNKLRANSRSRESDALFYTSSRHPRRPPRRSRSLRRSRTPPSETSGSSLDGRPCDMTTRSRSSRRTRSHSRRRSISPSVLSGHSRTPSQRRSTSRLPSAHPSSDRRFSSSSRHRDRSHSRSASPREHFSSPRSFNRPHYYRRRRAIENELGFSPRPARPPTGPRSRAQFNTSSQRVRDSDRRIVQDSIRRTENPPSLQPPLPPPLSPNPAIPSTNTLDDASDIPPAHPDIENDTTSNPVATSAPLPVSPPPAIPKPPRSPKRLRPTVHSIRKAPGMPPIAPVAQTSAGVRRFFPGDDDEDEDEVVASVEPTKPLITVLHSEEPEVTAELIPKPPSPSPPPLPLPPKSPLQTVQATPSLTNWRQHDSEKPPQALPPLPPSSAPPPPPPSSAPPPPPLPPLSPVELTQVDPTAFVAQSAVYNRQSTIGHNKRQHSSRTDLADRGASDYWSTSSRRPFHRFSSRWHVRDVPPDLSKDATHLVAESDWESTSQVYTIDNPMHQMALQPDVHLPTNMLPEGNPVLARSTYTDLGYQNHCPPSNNLHSANQAPISHPQLPIALPPSNFSTDSKTPVQIQVSHGRRETKEVYERLVQVGEGTYGKVYKARNMETSELVAMKRIRMEAEKDGFPITAIREIKLLQGLHHPNIVNLVEMVVSKGHVYIVFEYMDHDLSGVLHHPSIHFTEAHTKSLMYQLLAGLQYMHEREVLHRDLKGSNILLNKLGQLKIADFGLARRFERGKEPGKEGRGRGRDYTNRVITLWYKPPELLFGATVYGEEVDMWSAGAIFLELFTRRPILQTGDEIDQLHATFKLMGTPTEKNWPEAFDLPWFELLKPKVELPSKLRETFFGIDKHVKTEAGMYLAEKLLSLRPDDRPSARDALKFAYFTLESPEMELPKDLLSNVKGEWHELESKRARRRKDV